MLTTSQEKRFHIIRIGLILDELASAKEPLDCLSTFLVMASRASTDLGIVRCSAATLTDATGLSKTTLLRHIRSLQRACLITRVKNGVYMCHPLCVFCGCKDKSIRAYYIFKRYFKKSTGCDYNGTQYEEFATLFPARNRGVALNKQGEVE
jgi:hypothetical protein